MEINRNSTKILAKINPPQSLKADNAKFLALIQQANSAMDTYNKEGAYDLTKIDKLIEEAQKISPKSSDILYTASKRLELIKISESIKMGASQLEEARKGCNESKAIALRRDGIAALEQSKITLLQTLLEDNKPFIKKQALFLYCEILSKQDYGVEKAVREADRIYSIWKNNFIGSISIEGRIRSGIGPINPSKDPVIYAKMNILRALTLIYDAEDKESLGKFTESQKLYSQSKNVVSELLTASDYLHIKDALYIKKEAYLVFCKILFQQGLTESSREWESLLKQIMRGNGFSINSNDPNSSFDQTISNALKNWEKAMVANNRFLDLAPANDLNICNSLDSLLKSAVKIAVVYDQINKSNFTLAKKIALDILKEKEEPYIKKQALILFCEALVKQNTKDSLSQAAQLYKIFLASNFSGTLDIDGAKPDCIDKPDESNDIKFIGKANLVIATDFINHGNFEDAKSKALDVLRINVPASLKKEAQRLIDIATQKEARPVSDNETDNDNDIKSDYEREKIEILMARKQFKDAAKNVLILLSQNEWKSYQRKQFLSELIDAYLGESSKKSIKDARLLLNAWISASNNKNNGEAVSFSFAAKDKDGKDMPIEFSNIESINTSDKNKTDDFDILAKADIAEIKWQIDEKNFETAKALSLKLSKNSNYGDYVKKQAVFSYCEALFGNNSADNLSEAAGIISEWIKEGFKGAIIFGKNDFRDVAPLKAEESLMFQAELAKHKGINEIANQNFESAIISFEESIKKGQTDPLNYIYAARVIYLADKWNAQQLIDEKYKIALENIFERIPDELSPLQGKKITPSILTNIALNEDAKSNQFISLPADPYIRMYILTVLESNSKSLMLEGNFTKASSYIQKAIKLIGSWDPESVAFGYSFESQLHYDLAEIYKYQNNYFGAYNEYKDIEKIKEAQKNVEPDRWLAQQIDSLSPNSFGINTGISQASLSPELFFRTYMPIGPLSTQEIFLSLSPNLSAASSDITLDNSFLGHASIFLNDKKSDILRNDFNFSSNGKMAIGLGYERLLDKMNLGGGLEYVSDGINSKAIKTKIASDVRLTKSINVRLSGDLDFPIDKLNAVTPNVSLTSHASKKIYNNLSLLLDAELSYGMKPQVNYGWKSLYSSPAGNSQEIKDWQWREIQNNNGSTSISFTRSSAVPPASDQSGDPESFWRKYYWLYETNNNNGLKKKIWHIGSALTTEVKEVKVQTNSSNPDENIPIFLKSINLVGLARNDGNSIIYGAKNSIETAFDSHPATSEIDAIDISKLSSDPKRPLVQIYSESYSSKNVNNETVIIMTSRKKSPVLGEPWPSQDSEQQTTRIRTLHQKLPNGQTKLMLYILDLVKYGDIAVPSSNEKLPQEEIIYEGEGTNAQGSTIQHYFTEKISAGLELETSIGIFGLKPFIEANQFMGIKTLTTAPDSNFLSYGLSLYGRSVPFIKLPYGSLSGELNIRSNQYQAETSTQLSGSLGYTYGF